MKKDYKILILGCANSIYIVNFIKFLKRENPQACIYLWGPKTNSLVVDKEFFDCLEDYYFFVDNIRYEKIPIVNRFERALLWRQHFRKFSKYRFFDIINIHYVFENYSYLLDVMRNCSSNIVLSPWGSDVYRIGRTSKYVLKYLYRKADYISGVDNRFTKDVMSIFKVPKSKIAYFDLGSATIDYILENKTRITTEEAKRNLGIEGLYAIALGYNASPAQQHLKVINAIAKIRNKLPENLALLFPFTYGGSPEYKQSVKDACKGNGLKAFYFEKFLELPELFLLRLATDMFIHVQTTDANSTSVGEYLLCDKKVLNGSWLRYDELEKDGEVPYFVVQDIERIDEAILTAFQSKGSKVDNRLLGLLTEKGCGINADRANSIFEKIS